MPPSRREMLQGTVGSLGLTGGVGSAAGAPSRGSRDGDSRERERDSGPPDGYPYEDLRYMIGVTSRATARRIRSVADEVHEVLDWGGDIGLTVVGTFSRHTLNALRGRANVRYIEPDQAVTADGVEPWGIDRTDADRTHDFDGLDGDTNAERGGSIDVAVLDTGIDSDQEAIQANLGTGKAFVSCTPTGDRSCNGSGTEGGGPNDNPCTEDWDDDDDHGTHCAGTIGADDGSPGVVGVAPDVTLHAAKVLDECGSGSTADVAAAIKWAADRDYDIASMSLGSSGSPTNTVVDACAYAYYGYSAREGTSNSAGGVLLVASTGNGNCSDCVNSPANISWVVGVTASNSGDSPASFNSTGPETDLIAPGVDVYSSIGGDGSTDNYDSLWGTSMACPHVAGAAALLMSNGYNHEEAKQMLYETAEDLGLASNTQGEGLVDPATALGVEGNTSGVIDSFENFDTSNDASTELEKKYTVDESSGFVTFNGNYHKDSGVQVSEGARIYTPAGSLQNDAVAGDTFVSHHYIFPSYKGAPRFLFGVQDGDNYYYAGADSVDDQLVLGKVDSGGESQLGSTSVSVPVDQWIQLQITWRTDGTMTAELRDPFETNIDPLSLRYWDTLATITVSDSTWTSGGHGWSEPVSSGRSLDDYATGTADTNSVGLAVVTDRPTLNGTSITVNGRYRNPTGTDVDTVGVDYRQIEPSVESWQRTSSAPANPSQGQDGFSFDLNTEDASNGCYGYQYYAWAELTDGTRKESRRIATWNDRTC